LKITFISDLHGENIWKDVINRDSDLFIFLGDYFDSFNVSHKDQLKNFEDLLFFAESNKNKVQLLLGNHDIHYLLWHTPYYDCMRGSGFSSSLVYKVNNLVREHEQLFQIAWQRGNVLATHAGLTQNYYFKELLEIHKRYKELNFAELLNMLWKLRSGKLMRVGKERGGGDEYGGVFWCDKSELTRDPLLGLVQVVGHTPLQKIEDIEIDSRTRLVFVDCLLYSTEKNKDSLIFTMEIE